MERAHAVRTAVAIRIEHHKTSLAKSKARRCVRIQMPEFADSRFVGCGLGLPAFDAGLLVKAQRHPVVGDPDGKDR